MRSRHFNCRSSSRLGRDGRRLDQQRPGARRQRSLP